MSSRSHKHCAVLVALLIAVSTWATPANGAVNDDPVTSTRLTHAYNEYNSIDWNICGGYGGGDPECNNASLTSAYNLATHVNGMSIKPMAVMLQEVCRDQYQYLKGYFEGMGYLTNRHSYTGGVGSACYSYGNVVFWLGGCEPGGCLTGNAFGSPYSGETDVRGWTCGKAAYPGYTACSTHLSPPDSAATPQANEMYNIIAVSNLFRPTLVGGDFNMEPTVGAMTQWYNNLTEVDGSCRSCKRSTHDDGERLDYIWIPNSMCILHDAYILSISTSDHHMYRGYFAMC